MKKLGIVSLMIVAMVAFCVSDASAVRYLGGTYYYNTSNASIPTTSSDIGGWGDKNATFNDIFQYDGTTALSDAASDAGLPRNPDGTANLVYTEPTNGDTNAVGENLGKSVWWWANVAHNNRTDWVFMDLGQVVELDAIATLHNFRRSGNGGMDWFKVYASNDESTWFQIIDDFEDRDGNDGLFDGEELIYRPSLPGKPALGLFIDPTNSANLVDTVSFRYLKLTMSPNAGGDSSFAIAEVLIDAVPEPATMLILLGGGLFGLLRRRS